MTNTPPTDRDTLTPLETTAPAFEDLTLAQAVGRLLRAPAATVRALGAVARGDLEATAPLTLPAEPVARPAPSQPAARVQDRGWIVLGIRLAALVVTWWGSSILANAPVRTEALALNVGAPYLIAGFLLWLGSEVYESWPSLRRWWADRGAPRAADDPARDSAEVLLESWGRIWLRVGLAAIGLIFSFLAWRLNADNRFTTLGFWSWMLSIGLWVGALAPNHWTPAAPLRWLRDKFTALDLLRNPIAWALILILALGATFRLSALDAVPPEMTSDHVEKILDARRVLDGTHQVFFPNNGGREGFQMYMLALMATLPGLGFDFTTLRLLSALEGLVAVALMFWLGREAMGASDRRLGVLVGLLLAALVAASYWHTALSRLGLRIVLTTAVTALLLLYLARAMRHNQRADFIKAGLVLGFGLYMYQAVRMLPVVVIAGVGIAFLFYARGGWARLRYLINLSTLVVVAFVVFVPLFGFWVQYPEDFWRRTSGRLLGDDIITTTDDQGRIIQRNATITERLDAFNQNMPVLLDNIRNALLMFNWKGDVAWINAAPNRPALDIITGALFALGLAAWLAWIIRRRDPFALLVPLALFIMLLPSALSIAYPVENPSHTRTSGALPSVYLIAALPLALIVRGILSLNPPRRGVLLAGALSLAVILGSYTQNSALYFGEYVRSYLNPSLPYSEAGRVLRGFADSDGALGNAFMIAYPYWWDHRAIGIAAGAVDWPNGIVALADVPLFLANASVRAGPYQLDPERDLLFFYAAEDLATEAQLQAWFPAGYAQLRQSYQADDQYRLFRVPRLGAAAFQDFLAQNLPG